jgi:flavin reductase (DIM6/NTAB) family NADH-FMN oxidoreductase RutF
MKKEKIQNDILIPMPVTIVGAICNGKENYMTVGWITRANANPPLIAIGINNSHLTWKGITENEEFSVNFPTAKDLLKTDYIGLVSGAKEDKSHLYTAHYGNLKKAPLIEECPLSLECKVVQKMDLPTNTLFVGEIIGAYANKEFMDKNNFNYEKAGTFLLTAKDNTYWSFGKKIGHAWKDGKSFKK